MHFDDWLCHLHDDARGTEYERRLNKLSAPLLHVFYLEGVEPTVESMLYACTGEDGLEQAQAA